MDIAAETKELEKKVREGMEAEFLMLHGTISLIKTEKDLQESVDAMEIIKGAYINIYTEYWKHLELKKKELAETSKENINV